ncbi:MAG: bifunctional nuclease family protein [Planctomycetes bacterium]|nr:bifunctional nuclease family protein [Planctomycetota bacterium]MCD7897894.1 bifunctional nuclease family protein [Planctomycetaceae bacterium]
MPDWIECELAQILLMTDSINSPQVIVLREKSGGRRSFMVHIGLFEALAINRQVHGEEMPRPLTHDLLMTLMTALGGKLLRVAISDLREDAEGNGTFYGFLVVEDNNTEIVIDCRPSDAIAMATRAECPIYVSRDVIDKVTLS